MSALHHFWFVWVWPSVKGNGPEDALATIGVAILTILLWPPIRRRIHAKFSVLMEHHRSHRADLAEIHRKLDWVITNHPDIPDLPAKESAPS